MADLNIKFAELFSQLQEVEGKQAGLKEQAKVLNDKLCDLAGVHVGDIIELNRKSHSKGCVRERRFSDMVGGMHPASDKFCLAVYVHYTPLTKTGTPHGSQIHFATLVRHDICLPTFKPKVPGKY